MVVAFRISVVPADACPEAALIRKLTAVPLLTVVVDCSIAARAPPGKLAVVVVWRANAGVAAVPS